ncbi:hypothetical protein BDZ97DRAFT_1864407 [Flammula alnicola]|nr:hypothetical protein BDZ97DRAFT_1864407 [Flammula alnicola]
MALWASIYYPRPPTQSTRRRLRLASRTRRVRLASTGYKRRSRRHVLASILPTPLPLPRLDPTPCPCPVSHRLHRIAGPSSCPCVTCRRCSSGGPHRYSCSRSGDVFVGGEAVSGDAAAVAAASSTRRWCTHGRGVVATPGALWCRTRVVFVAWRHGGVVVARCRGDVFVARGGELQRRAPFRCCAIALSCGVRASAHFTCLAPPILPRR